MEQHEAFPQAVHVVAAIIERQGRFLICRRNDNKRHGGLWEFPGGKLEAGETHADAAERELDEELGLQLVEFRGVGLSLSDPESIFVIDFGRASVRGDPIAREHSEIRWVGIGEFDSLDLAPSDRIAARHISSHRL